MRIQDNKPVGAARKSSKTARSRASGGVFSLDDAPESESAAPTGMVGSALSIADVSALLAVQGMSGKNAREQAIEGGHQTLDALDALKIDVLSGQVTRHKLHQLAALVEKQRSQSDDPALDNVLDHIELRARVELAKFEQRRR